MADIHYLADTSVLERADQHVWNTGAGAGTQPAGVDEPADRPRSRLRSRARDVADVIEEQRALPSAPIDASVMDRVVQVARGLARSSRYCGAKPVDLVIACGRGGRALGPALHLDDRVAAVTNQSTECISPAGTPD